MALHHEAGQMAAPDYVSSQFCACIFRGVHRCLSGQPNSAIISQSVFVWGALVQLVRNGMRRFAEEETAKQIPPHDKSLLVAPILDRAWGLASLPQQR
jgi:hypothetical protein